MENESMDFVQTFCLTPPPPESLDPKIGINRLIQFPLCVFSTTKFKVWIWGLTPPTPLDKFHTFIFLFY